MIQYDEVIRKAIAYHSLYKVPKGLDSFLLKQVLLIRDSDKLDNFKSVKILNRFKHYLVLVMKFFILKEYQKIF